MALSSLQGRVVVLIFGSYTCPTFRSRAAALEKLNVEVGTRANLYVVYTKEIHPLGGWEVERNKEEKIQVERPTTIAGRETIARECRGVLHLSMPFLIDDMNDTAATALGLYPNGAVVINRDGTIAATQKWTEAATLRREIDAAAAREYHSSPS